ncbi:Uncharacterized protein TCM_004954 [Theobroma cacao]|uniref:Uncharacterized protein n=1 Tax=Theobroma cacao TaxID=3641 RepID=A0A061DSU2_THECC|nr:Uncharacterized protein TCM_004954 [Theobroma cacao]
MSICLACDLVGDAGCLDLTLALIMPPLGVFRKRGTKSEFWLSICLTLALFLPGSIYAFNIVTSKENNGTK